MADTQVVNLAADTAPTSDDLVYIINDPAGTPGDRKVTVAQLRKGLLPGATTTTDNRVMRANGTAGDIQDSALEIADTGDATLAAAVVGGDLLFNVTNSDNTNAGSNARYHAQSGGTSGGDAKVTFRIGAAGQEFGIGIDNSASDSFVLSRSNALGTNNVFSVDTSGNLTLTGSTVLGTPASGDITNLAATQAQQEAGSIVSAAVTPGRQHFHPSAAKGWVFAGTTGSSVVSYNVTSVTDGGTGDMTVGWGTDFSTDNYVPVVTPITSGANATRIAVANAGATQVICFNTSTGTATDPSGYFVIAFGDHA